MSKSSQVARLLHPIRPVVDLDHFPVVIECLNDSVSIGILKDLADKVRAVERMVPVTKIGVEDEKLFQVWSCADERQEYFNNFLSIPLNITHIHRP